MWEIKFHEEVFSSSWYIKLATFKLSYKMLNEMIVKNLEWNVASYQKSKFNKKNVEAKIKTANQRWQGKFNYFISSLFWPQQLFLALWAAFSGTRMKASILQPHKKGISSWKQFGRQLWLFSELCENNAEIICSRNPAIFIRVISDSWIFRILEGMKIVNSSSRTNFWNTRMHKRSSRSEHFN